MHGDESFSQAGEDLIVRFFFKSAGSARSPTSTLGQNDPIELSNTYYFYRKGYRGVLVEPNVSLCEKLRAVRPEDTTLVAGIGATSAKEADYYIMSEPGLNTFSKEEADHQTEVTKGRFSVKEVIKMPLLNINDVMIKYFRDAPTFLSVDTEGLDLEIFKSTSTTSDFPAQCHMRRDAGFQHDQDDTRDSRVHGEPGLRRPRRFLREYRLRRLEDPLNRGEPGGQRRGERFGISQSPRMSTDSHARQGVIPSAARASRGAPRGRSGKRNHQLGALTSKSGRLNQRPALSYAWGGSHRTCNCRTGASSGERRRRSRFP